MTYLPTKPPSTTTTPLATTLSDADLFPLTQSGVSRSATLATLRSFVQAGATGTSTGSTGSTSGSTGATGSSGTTTSGPTTNPTNTSNSSPVARNAATTAAPVTLLALSTQTAPAVSAGASGESPDGTLLTSASGSITTSDGKTITLQNSGNGLEVYQNGVNMHMVEGNYGFYPFPATQLKWKDHALLIRSPQNGYDDWYACYGPDSNGNWNTCYIIGEDWTLTDTFVTPTASAGTQPYPLGVHIGNPDGGRYNLYEDACTGLLGPLQFYDGFNVFNQEWNTWASAAGGIVGTIKGNSRSANLVPLVGIKMARNYYGYGSEPEALEGETLNSGNYGSNAVCSLIFDNHVNSSGNSKPNHWQMDNTFSSGRFGVAYYSEDTGNYTQVAGTDSPGVSRIVYTNHQVHYQDTGGNWHGPWNGTNFPSESNPLPSTYSAVASYRNANNREFVDIASGAHDADITGVADAWHGSFPVVYWRIAYEFNGGFMPDYFGDGGTDTVTLPRWIAAFQHMATLIRASATKKGVKAIIIWNPNVCQYSTNLVTDAWPGDSYVDVIGLDRYSPVYNNNTASANLYDWSKDDGKSTNPDNPTWMAVPENRIIYWDYGGVDQYAKTSGNTDGLGNPNQFGMQRALAFAKSKNRPIFMCETGAGNTHKPEYDNSGNREPARGPVDDPVFPLWLRSRLDQAVNMGVPVIGLVTWSTNESDGGWGYMDAERRRQRQSWSAAFGGTTAAALLTVGAGTSTGSASSSTGSTSSGGSTGSTTTTSTSTGVATVAVSDTSGKTVTITLSSYQTFYSSDTKLGEDIYYYADSGNNNVPTVGSSADGNITALVITKNGTSTVSSPGLAGVTTYSGTSSTGSTSSSSSGVATAKITDTSGNIANLTLSAYKTFYGSNNDTALVCNIYYYFDTGVNRPLVGSSADGTIASIVIAKNGTATTSTDSLAGVTTYA